MAGEVQLKLGVSLDLGYFRTEMQKAVNIVNSEFTGRLKVNFDRRILDKELNNLQRAVKRRVYRIEIGGNIDTLPDKIKNLQQRLKELESFEAGIGVTAHAAVTKKDARKVRGEVYRQVVSESGKILLPVGLASISQIATDRFKADLLKKIGTVTVNVKTNLEAQAEGSEAGSPKTFRQELSELNLERLKNIYAAAARDALLSFEEGIANNKGKIITALNQAAQDAGHGFVNALQDQESNLFVAAGKYANSLLSGLKKTLKIQSPSLEMWEIGSDAGKGFEEGLLKALEIAENSAVQQTRRMLDRLARMVMMAAGISGPTIDRQLLEAKAPSPINFPATIPPRQSISSGPLSTGRALPPGRDPAGLISGQTPIGLLPSISGRSQIQAVVEALIAQQGPRMLPSGGGPLVDTKRTYAEINKRFDQLRQRMFTVLESDIKEVSMGIKDSLNYFAFLVQALKDAETRSKNNRIEEQVDAFFASIENALRLAAARAKVEAVKIQDLGAQPIRGVLPAGTLPPSPPLLPAAGGTGGYFGGGRRPGGGFVPEGGFPSDGMAIGPQGPKNMLSLDYYKNAFKYAEALKIAEASAKNFRASNLPLIGGLQGIAAEFGEATKQVLLYGTAYKGLAFITSLPGQILNAAKSQQQYSNAMQVATQETGTFAKEMLFVDNVQRAFGLNLETTRQGFARLYASMAPAGFDSGSIEKLFTGISAATAALQLTPDKAERVIYAFGQMASKGQAMSEELKGQLGDVLPGALSIFAKAAGKSVKEFNAELEKGVYSGGKFRELMTNVTDELINRFGSGAAAAGRSLQGLLNTLQGDFQRTLESFSPLANAAAQAVLQPIASSLKQLSVSAQIATGEIDRIQGQIKQAQQVVSDLKLGGADSGDIAAAEKNVLALQVRYEALNEALKNPAIAKQVQDIQRFTEELAKAGTFVMNVASAIGSALSPIINVLGTNLTTVISLITSFYVGFQTARLAAMALMGVLLAYRTLSSILGFGPAALSANALASAFNVLGVAATGANVKVVGLRLALTALVASTVVGLVVAGVMAIAGAFATMRDRAKEAGQSSRDAAKAAVEAANSGNVAMANMQVQTILSESRANKKALETLQKLRDRATPLQREGGFKIELTPEEAAALRGSKLTENLLRETKGGVRQAQLPTNRLMRQLMRDFGSVSGEQAQNLREAKAAQQEALRNEKRLGLNQPTPGTLPPEPESEKDTGRRQREAEKLANQQQQLAIDTANRQNALDKASFDAKMSLLDQDFEHFKAITDAKNNYELTGIDSIQARQLKHQQELQKIELNRIDKVRKLQAESAKAVIEQINAQRTATAAAAGGGGGATGGGSAIFGATGRVRQAAGWVHGHFQNMNRQALMSDVTSMVKALLEQGVTPELGSGKKFAKGMSDAEIQKIVSQGISGHKKYASGISAVDVFVPEGTKVPLPLSGVKNYGGAMGYGGVFGSGTEVGHLDPRSKSGAGAYTRARKEAKAENKAEVEQVQLQNKLLLENNGIRFATIQAIEETRALIAQNIDTIYPVAEQQLENRLLAMRNSLQLQGMPQEYISFKEQSYKADYEAALALVAYKKNALDAESELNRLQQKKKDGIALTEAEVKIYGTLDEGINRLTGEIEQYKKAIADLPVKQLAFTRELLKTTIENLRNAEALKKQQEALQRIDSAVTGVSGSYKGMIKSIAMGSDSKEAIKEFQQSIADQFIGMFLDYAMKPVESFMKEAFAGMFGIKTEEQARKEALDKAQAQLDAINEQIAITKAIKQDTGAIASGGPGGGQQQGQAFASAFAPQGTMGSLQAFGMGGTASSVFGSADMAQAMQSAQSFIDNGGFTQVSDQFNSLASSTKAFTGNFNLNIDSLKNANESFKQVNVETQKNGLSFTQALGKTVQGIGIAATTVMGIMSGINQIKEGGTSNTLAGIGSIFMSLGSAVGGFVGMGLLPGKKAANGGIATGGWKPFPIKPFATGGVVNGPTLGLVGEGKYNEAIVPLPDGRSIPVIMKGDQPSSRELLSGKNSSSMASSPVLNMSFQTTTINGVEYVSRDQLEAAMMETRKLAARDGANRGAALAIDRLQHSPNTRRRIGMS